MTSGPIVSYLNKLNNLPKLSRNWTQICILYKTLKFIEEESKIILFDQEKHKLALKLG